MMRKCRVVFPVLWIFSVCILPALEGQTNVSAGTITTDTTWDVSGSPFIVACGGVTVAAGVTLTIAPGVVVKFNAGNACNSSNLLLNIYGRFVANGTSTQP